MSLPPLKSLSLVSQEVLGSVGLDLASRLRRPPRRFVGLRQLLTHVRLAFVRGRHLQVRLRLRRRQPRRLRRLSRRRPLLGRGGAASGRRLAPTSMPRRRSPPALVPRVAVARRQPLARPLSHRGQLTLLLLRGIHLRFCLQWAPCGRARPSSLAVISTFSLGLGALLRLAAWLLCYFLPSPMCGGEHRSPCHFVITFFGGVWEPFLYGLNTHKQSVCRSKDTCQGDPRPEASAQTTQVT